MTLTENIVQLRNEKKTYKAIATELNCTVDKVRYACQKAGLSNVGLSRNNIVADFETTSKNKANRCKNRRVLQKQRCVEELGGACAHCGYNKHLAVLEFHHVDGSTKSDCVGSLFGSNWNRIKSELEKCILLCANCHREEHVRLQELKN